MRVESESVECLSQSRNTVCKKIEKERLEGADSKRNRERITRRRLSSQVGQVVRTNNAHAHAHAHTRVCVCNKRSRFRLFHCGDWLARIFGQLTVTQIGVVYHVCCLSLLSISVSSFNQILDEILVACNFLFLLSFYGEPALFGIENSYITPNILLFFFLIYMSNRHEKCSYTEYELFGVWFSNECCSLFEIDFKLMCVEHCYVYKSYFTLFFVFCTSPASSIAIHCCCMPFHLLYTDVVFCLIFEQ